MNIDFSFPYEPYQIQNDFMNNLYQTLQNCRGGLFESPTGTGKTLSIICGSITFLEDYYSALLRQSESSESPRKKPCNSARPSKSIHMMKSALALEKNARIVYLTRTHSQLDQFTSELKRTKWGRENSVRVVRLASRWQLCINSQINNDKTMIDYECKMMNSNVSQDEELKGIKIEKYLKPIKKSGCCPYYLLKEHAADMILEKISDIEDLCSVGGSTGGCPYYGTRSALDKADIILAPYSSILSKHGRASIGIDLENSYVIIDESHNLINAIIDQHSSSITTAQINSSLSCFMKYLDTYSEKMFPRKRMFVDQSIKILKSVLSFIRLNESRKFAIENQQNFVKSFKLESIKFYEISGYYEEENLLPKILGIEKNPSVQKLTLSGLQAFQTLLNCLDDRETKIIVSKDTTTIFRVLLLNPYSKFKELLTEAKCVVLAGGTLSPDKEFRQFFADLPRHQFKAFSCGHVVSPQNLFLAPISYTNSNRKLDFTYKNRENDMLYKDLTDIIYQLSCVVPNGIVVFLPSFAFLAKVQDSLTLEAYENLSQKKQVFFDSRDESVIKSYSEAAEGTGAVLFAVVRGTLSEGINFSDKLGRCVVVVGMPYLNRNDPEIVARMQYYDSSGWYSGQEFYENSCEVAINQSIGRAIRHIRDFAAVVLIDYRHRAKLKYRPNWMSESVYDGDYQKILRELAQFFRKKAKES